MRQTQFLPRQHYQSTNGYRLLPFRFLQFNEREKLLVNEVGEYVYLDNPTFDALVSRSLDRCTDAYLDLKGKHFLFDGEPCVPIELLATKYRTKKAHLAGFTKLHIFVVSLRC